MEFPAIYGIQRFITMCTQVQVTLQLTCYWTL